MENKRKKLPLLLGIAAGIWLGLRYLLPLLMPFLLGAGLALLAEPITRTLHTKLRLPRSVAAGISVSAVFMLLALFLLVLCALILRELGVLATILPDLGQTARSGLELLRQWLLSLTGRVPSSLQAILRRNITDLFSGSSALLDQALRYVLGLAGTLLAKMPDSALTLGTAVISGFMISAKLPQFREGLSRRFPKERLAPALTALQGVKAAIGGWLFAQVKLCGVTWGILTLGFLILGIPYAPLWAGLTALVDAFPILGTGTVLIPWSAIAFLQNNVPRGIGLLGVYAVISLTRSALEPKLVGRQLGLDPLLTLMALYIGYQLWGLGGMILAPLLTVVLKQSLPLFSSSE